MQEEKFSQWIATSIKNTKDDLLAKTQRADLVDIRYLSGQLHSLLTAQAAFEQIRKEGEDA